jgi:hypothetical protein
MWKRTATLLLMALPALGAGRDVTTPTFGSTPYAVRTPVIATNGMTFLTLWTVEIPTAGPYVFGSLADDAGTIITPVAFVVVPHVRVEAVFASRSNYVALVMDENYEYRIATLSPEGRQISLSAGTRRAVRNYPHVAFDGQHFFVIDIDSNSDDHGVAYLIDLQGNIDELTLWPYDSLNGTAYDVVFVPNSGFVVITVSREGLFLQHFAGSGFALSPKKRISAGYDASLLSIAWNGDSFLIASAAFCCDIGVVAVSSDGSIIARSSIAARNMTSLAIEWNGDAYVVVGQGYEMNFACRFDERGNALDPPVPLLYPIAGYLPLSVSSNGKTVMTVGANFQPPSVLAARLDIDSHSIHPGGLKMLSNTLRRQSVDDIATDGLNFVATWTDQASASDERRSGTSLSPDGVALDPWPTDLDQNAAPYGQIAGYAHPHSSVAFGKSMYLVVTERGSDIVARRVVPGVGILDSNPILIGTFGELSDRAVAWNGKQFMVAWKHGGDSRATFIDEDGVVSEAKKIPNAGSTAWDGQHFFIASLYYITSGTNCTCPWPVGGVQVDRLAIDGTPVDSIRIPAWAATDVHVASGAQESLVVIDAGSYWSSTSVLAYALHSDNILKVDPPINVFTWFGQVTSDVAWNGNSYTVAWHAGYGPQWWLSTAHVIASKPVIDRVTTPAGAAEANASPAIAVNRNGRALVIVSDVLPADGVARAHVFSDDDKGFTPVPRAPRTPRIISVVTTKDHFTTVTWESDDADVAGFQFEFDTASYVLRSGIPATFRSSTFYSFYMKSLRIRAFNVGGVSDPSPTFSTTPPPRHRAAGH